MIGEALRVRVAVPVLSGRRSRTLCRVVAPCSSHSLLLLVLQVCLRLLFSHSCELTSEASALPSLQSLSSLCSPHLLDLVHQRLFDFSLLFLTCVLFMFTACYVLFAELHLKQGILKLVLFELRLTCALEAANASCVTRAASAPASHQVVFVRDATSTSSPSLPLSAVRMSSHTFLQRAFQLVLFFLLLRPSARIKCFVYFLLCTLLELAHADHKNVV